MIGNALKKIRFALGAAKRDERGVALIFTLGILGLLMVIALGFASTAITERKSASNSNNLTVSSAIAQSALERVVGVLNYYSGGVAVMNDLALISRKNAPSSGIYDYDWLWHLNSDGYTIMPAPSSKYQVDSVNWQYIDNGLATSSADYAFIGRFAYVVLPGGKLDPTAAVDSTGTATRFTEGTEDRVGIWPAEISLVDVANDSALTDSMKSIGDTSKLPAGKRWLDFNQLASTFVSSDANRSSFANWFQILPAAQPEAYWLDYDFANTGATTNNDGIKKASEYYHRFNLARTDWGSLSVSSILADPAVYSPATSATGGLNWLNQWQDAGGFSSVDLCKKQIAANLIDFCDADDEPTSDVANASWSSTVPTYTGNEKTPYINELDIELQVSVSVTPPVLPAVNYTYDLTVIPTFKGEIIDLYGLASSGDKLEIYGNIGLSFAGTNYNIDNAKTVATDDFATISFDFDGAWTAGYTGKSYSMATLSKPGITSTNATETVAISSFNISKVILKRTAKNRSGATAEINVDYANLNTLVPTDMTVGTFGVGSPAVTKYISFQVADPRQNLNASDWGAPANSLGSGIETYMAVNSGKVTDIGASGDAENMGGSTGNAQDPAYRGTSSSQHLSTAYIRNDVMRSPWELGCIHRGSKWQTLNIANYRTPSGSTKLFTGGGVYADGDANILDQVKFTDAVSAYGKIDINTTSLDILRALFARIVVAKNDTASGTRIYQARGAGGDVTIDTSIADQLAALMKDCSSSHAVFTNRAAVVRDSNGMRAPFSTSSLGSIGALTTKAEKEEIVGKFINLTDVQDSVKVIVLAQSIQDVGSPNSGAGIPVNKDWNNNGTLGETLTKTDTVAMKNAGYYDVKNSVVVEPNSSSISLLETVVAAKKGQYDIGADRITGEVKLIATLVRDIATNKWKIVRVEYPEN